MTNRQNNYRRLVVLTDVEQRAYRARTSLASSAPIVITNRTVF